MPEYLKLKSVATQVYDYRNVDLTPYLPPFQPDEALIEKDIQRQRNRHGVKQSCTHVATGDLIVLSCDSESEKFCKKSISLPVGKGLFSRELEAKLVGMEVGKEGILTVGDTAVAVRVEKATRTVLPELTDAAVAAWGMEGISNLVQLRKFCINRQIEAMLPDWEEADMASAAVWCALSDNSSVVLDEEEIAMTRAEAAEKLAEMRAPQAAWEESEEESPEEEASEEAAGESVDMEQMVYDLFLTGLRMAAIGQKLAEESGRLLTMEDYEKYIQIRLETFPEKTEEQIRAKYTPAYFTKEEYGDRVAVLLDQYIAESFKKALNP